MATRVDTLEPQPGPEPGSERPAGRKLTPREWARENLFGSTFDTILLMKKLYPSARIRVGGIYPTLAPHHLRRALDHLGQRMRRLQRGDDAFRPGQQLEGLQRLVVLDRHIFDAA